MQKPIYTGLFKNAAAKALMKARRSTERVPRQNLSDPVQQDSLKDRKLKNIFSENPQRPTGCPLGSLFFHAYLEALRYLQLWIQAYEDNSTKLTALVNIY